MSDISITFPPWIGAWFLLGQAAPVTTLGVIGLGAALLFGRGARRVGLPRCLKWALAIVGTAWVAGIIYWAFVLADQIMTDIYRARHNYGLAKTTIMAGIELPQGSWVFLDEEWRLYEIDTQAGANVSIDGVLWQGEIRLIPEAARSASDRGIIKSATLAADAVIQGTPCRAGKTVEFTESDGDLLRCTLARRTTVAAEIADAQGDMITEDLACAENRDIEFRIFGHRLLERCVLADMATVGSVACAGGEEIVLSGDGLDACSLATAQRVGSFDLAAGTRVRFTRGWLSNIEMPLASVSLAVSGLDVPPGTTVALCDGSEEIEYLEVPEDRYVAVAGVKLTGRMNFDCGRFRYGSLFENTDLRGRSLPRHALVSRADIVATSAR